MNLSNLLSNSLEKYYLFKGRDREKQKERERG